MRYLGSAAALTLGLLGASQALEAKIFADSNRDGKVDIGGNDVAGKNTWTEKSGALFLANIGDSNRRCASQIAAEDPSDAPPLPPGAEGDGDEDGEDDDECGGGDNGGQENYNPSEGYPNFNSCNDASDNIQRNPKYLAPVLTAPIPTLGNSATGSVVVINQTAASKVRVFLKEGSNWTYIASNYTFKADQLRKGLSLGVDAREVRTVEWDGRATLQFSVKDQGKEAKDSVAMRVAPVLTHHHAQLTEQVVSSWYSGILPPDSSVQKPESDMQKRFVDDLEKISKKAGVKGQFVLVNTTDTWAQDFFEPGYTTMPGPTGPIVLRIMVASAQHDRRQAHRWIFRNMRSDSMGAVQQPWHGFTTDSTGNLETVPPYTLNGKSYPAGRTIMGSQNKEKPHMVKFLNAQEVQAPIEMDTTWLKVGHVDEFVQFLPAKNKRGWVMMVDDALAGLAILQQAQKQGHGKVRAVSRPVVPGDAPATCVPTSTIDDLLKMVNITDIQKYCDESIKTNIAILKRETGVTDAEIIRVPALFHPEPWACGPSNNTGPSTTSSASPQKPQKTPGYAPSPRKPGQGGSRKHYGNLKPYANIREAAGVKPGSIIRRQDGSAVMQVSAMYPGCINGVVLSDKEYVAPNPWGPVIGGKDVLAAAVTAAYAKANYTVHYMDDWHTHHTNGGEVHCGSNTIRKTTAQWW
ncbi:Protein-arginine deiminase [Cordyceps fumosorosea ARSEF 2679]|uniref:Protein-arginine deiminase n=1 Tax=Cordyceps fumosorosea (strain ARSEF 2679) TaxID=1081104 RepID=A0A167R5V4_CORFA|nr:Protein-arginine deiminase [Cordyceps fumosorosea ARSEF 2679]OAA58297.1 Protein-arginine deiminase [Cordyceps fumosorosea ARSEF 2679]